MRLPDVSRQIHRSEPHRLLRRLWGSLTLVEAYDIMRRCGWHDPKEADLSGTTVAQCVRAAAGSLEAGTAGWGALVRVSVSKKCADRRRAVIGYPLTPQGAILNAENHDDVDEEFVLKWMEDAIIETARTT